MPFVFKCKLKYVCKLWDLGDGRGLKYWLKSPSTPFLATTEKNFIKKKAIATQGLLLHTACSCAFLPCSTLGMFSYSTNFPFSLPLLCPFWQGREVRNRINCGRGCHPNSQSNKSPGLALSHPSALWEGRWETAKLWFPLAGVLQWSSELHEIK